MYQQAPILKPHQNRGRECKGPSYGPVLEILRRNEDVLSMQVRAC